MYEYYRAKIRIGLFYKYKHWFYCGKYSDASLIIQILLGKLNIKKTLFVDTRYRRNIVERPCPYIKKKLPRLEVFKD